MNHQEKSLLQVRMQSPLQQSSGPVFHYRQGILYPKTSYHMVNILAKFVIFIQKYDKYFINRLKYGFFLD